MASSGKSSSGSAARPDLAARVAAQLEGVVKSSDRLMVALSGGVDSVVLLDCLRNARRRRGFRLAAIHVNHQLSRNASRWEAFCRRLCRSWRIPFRSVRVDVRRDDSVETGAREARYAAFARQDCDYVVLAHHRDDQVETLLLQLLRGAGVKGLAAMPLLRTQGPGRRGGESGVAGSSFPVPRPSSPKVLRPLLEIAREEILAHARARGLRWVEDESNRDVRHRRNFLRQEILPALERRFPACRATLARAARHFAEASALLDELAVIDGAPGPDEDGPTVRTLRSLSPARARNLLRYFLQSRGVAVPGADRLGEALRQAVSARGDARLAVELGGVALMRHAGRLHLVPRLPPLRRGYVRRWNGERRLRLPDLGGELEMVRARGRGISLGRLGRRSVTVRVRRGGERFRPDPRRPRRSLKNLLQEAGVPPWCRDRMPLLFHGGDLVWVHGIGIDSAYRAGPQEDGLVPVWREAATPRAAARRPPPGQSGFAAGRG